MSVVRVALVRTANLRRGLFSLGLPRGLLKHAAGGSGGLKVSSFCGFLSKYLGMEHSGGLKEILANCQPNMESGDEILAAQTPDGPSPTGLS